MKTPLVGGDLRNVSLVTVQPKQRNRPEGGKKGRNWQKADYIN